MLDVTEEQMRAETAQTLFPQRDYKRQIERL
jgi:hypothetical protein